MDFAGSDGLLSESDYANYPGLQMYPVLAGMVVPILGPMPGMQRVPGVTAPDLTDEDMGKASADAIVISREVLADLFRGVIRYWNDTAITSDNPHLVIPGLPVIPVVRSDKSGTTEIFKRALVSFSSVFADEIGCESPANCAVSLLSEVIWPSNISSYRLEGPGSSGVTARTILTPGGIGYTSLAGAVATGVGIARVRNRAGTAVSASVPSLDAALFEKGGNLNRRFNADIHDAFSALAWPIAGYTYLIWQKEASGMRINSTCSDRQRALQFWEWMYTSPVAAAGASAFSFSVLPSFLRERIVAEMRQNILCEHGPALGTASSTDLGGTGSLMAQAAMQLFTSAYRAVDASLPVQYAANSAIAVRNAQFTSAALGAGSSDYVVTVRHPDLATGTDASAVPTHSVPIAIAPLNIIFRLPGVPSLRFSIESLVRIFLTGEATTWNDPSIAAANPDILLPSTPIRGIVPIDTPEAGFIFGAFLSRFSATAKLTIESRSDASSQASFMGGIAPLADVWASSITRVSESTSAAELTLNQGTVTFMTARAKFPGSQGALVMTPANAAAMAPSLRRTETAAIVQNCVAADPAYTGAMAGSVVLKPGEASNAACAAAAAAQAGTVSTATGVVRLERLPLCRCWPLSVPLYVTMAANFTSVVDEAADSAAASTGITAVPTPPRGCVRGAKQLSFMRWMLGADSVVNPLRTFSLSPLPLPTRTAVSSAAGAAVKCDGEPLQPSGCRVGEQAVAGSELCVACPADSYSLDTSGVCKPCPIGARCPGGAVILAAKGYWQLDADFEQVFKCSTGSCCPADSCAIIDAGRCGDGYSDSSLMCARCDVARGFAYSMGACTECRGPNAPALITVIALGFIFVVLMMQGDARAWAFKLFTDFAQLATIVGTSVGGQPSVRWVRVFALDVITLFAGSPPCLWPVDPLTDSFFSMIIVGLVLAEGAVVFMVEVAYRKLRKYRSAWKSRQVAAWREAGRSDAQIRNRLCWQGCCPSVAVHEAPSSPAGPGSSRAVAASTAVMAFAAAAGGESGPHASRTGNATSGGLPSLQSLMSIGSRWMLNYITLIWRLLFISYVAIVKTGMRLIDCQAVGDVSVVRSRNGIQCQTPQHIIFTSVMVIIVIIISVVLPIVHCRSMRAELGPSHVYRGVSKIVKGFQDLLDRVLCCGCADPSKVPKKPTLAKGRGKGRSRGRRWSIVMLDTQSLRTLQYELGGWIFPDQRIWFESFFFLRKTVCVLIDVFVTSAVERSVALFVWTVAMLVVLVVTRPIATRSASITMMTMSLGVVGLAGIDLAVRVYEQFVPTAPEWLLTVGVIIFFIPMAQFFTIFLAILCSNRFPVLRSFVAATTAASSVRADSGAIGAGPSFDSGALMIGESLNSRRSASIPGSKAVANGRMVGDTTNVYKIGGTMPYDIASAGGVRDTAAAADDACAADDMPPPVSREFDTDCSDDEEPQPSCHRAGESGNPPTNNSVPTAWGSGGM